MLDLKILGLMFKEEYRLQQSFFSQSYFLASTLVLMAFTFIMGVSLPMLRRAIPIDDLLLVAHWIILFYGLAVGGFALMGDRVLERRFGSVSMIWGTAHTLPITFKRLFALFYVKDTLYYIFLTILPMILGLALAALLVPISPWSLLYLFGSLTLSFLLGISASVLLFTIVARVGGQVIAGLAIIIAAGLLVSRANVWDVAMGLPPLRFYYSHSWWMALLSLAVAVVLSGVAVFFVRDAPSPRERRADEAYTRLDRILRMAGGLGRCWRRTCLTWSGAE